MILYVCVFRLEEDAFTEPTQTYYTLEIKAIKFKRDSLIKVTHQVILNSLRIHVYKAYIGLEKIEC